MSKTAKHKKARCPRCGRPLSDQEPPKFSGGSNCETCAPRTCRTANGTEVNDRRPEWRRKYGVW